MKKGCLYFLALSSLLLLLAAFFLWRFSVSSQTALEASIRQYEQIQTKLERYLDLMRSKTARDSENEDLFARINRIAAGCGVGSRLENLRPAGKEEESLELQLRSLYLGETMHFISLIEALERVNIESLVMRRGVNNLLDLEIRIKRQSDSN